MSIDFCQRCNKRLDTDFVEYQPDGSLYCGACEADLEEAKLQEPDWKALAGELAEALDALIAAETNKAWRYPTVWEPIVRKARAALAKYEQEERE